MIENRAEADKKSKVIKEEEEKTALVVDDDEVICYFLTEVLNQEGYQVIVAPNGQKALEIIRKRNLSLVLLDFIMPVMDGIDTLRELRKIDKNIPVIMLSAFFDSKTILETARLGAHSCVTKPLGLKKIRTIIKEAVEVSVKSRGNELRDNLDEGQEMNQRLEKRKNGIRIPHGLEARIVDKKNSQKIAHGVVQNIGMGGAKIVCDLLFEKQDKVTLEIKLSLDLGSLIVEAQTFRIEPLFFGHNTKKYSVAFKFDKLTPEIRKKIKRQLALTTTMLKKSYQEGG